MLKAKTSGYKRKNFHCAAATDSGYVFSVGRKDTVKGLPPPHARMEHQLNQLRDDLAQLEKRCSALLPPANVTGALRQFKELTPLFETVDSFVAVANSQAQRLELEKVQPVIDQLTRLQTSLWQLRLTVTAPILERMAQDIRQMPLGSRFVLERWQNRLSDLRQQATVQQPGFPLPLLAHIEGLTSGLIANTPDLTAFD